MLLSVVLVLHITLALAVIAGFVYRYVLAFRSKTYPIKGRKAVFSGTAGLVVTGVLLAIIGKLPITALCLDSLGIVVALLVMEFALQKLPGILAPENNKTDK